jgi:hypothetical protein
MNLSRDLAQGRDIWQGHQGACLLTAVLPRNRSTYLS